MTTDIEVGSTGKVATSPGPLADLLNRVDLANDISHVTVIASDGYRASIPLSTLREGGMLSLENGAWRLRVVDGATLCWNVKAVVRLEPTTGAADDDIPARPDH